LTVFRDVLSTAGVRLLDSGAILDCAALEHLLGHTLIEPIVQCVRAGDLVQEKALLSVARVSVAAVPLLGHFEARLGTEARRVWSALEKCAQTPAVMLRLTVARNTDYGMYQHAVRTAFLALFIGVMAGFSESDLHAVGTAALMHDVGMMHMDAAPWEGRRSLSVSERRMLQKHPLIGQQIALSELMLAPSIATAIAQHHERIDGSGYPDGLSGAAISPLARVLMLVEVASGVLDSVDGDPVLQLSITLRANQNSLDRELCELLLAALPGSPAPVGPAAFHRAELRRVGALLTAWRIACERVTGADAPQFVFVNERMQRLHRMLAEVSIRSEGPTEAAATSVVCAEIGALGREALWQTRQIAYDTRQRWPDTGERGSLPGQDAVNEWIYAAMKLTDVPTGANQAPNR